MTGPISDPPESYIAVHVFFQLAGKIAMFGKSGFSAAELPKKRPVWLGYSG